MSLKIKFTDAGKAALVNPANIGTAALDITHIEVGSATYNPDGSETDLQNSIKTLSTFGGDTVADNVIHVTIRDDSSDVYSLGEIGLRSGTGVLMGVISTQGEVITQKGPNDVLLLSADATLTEVDVSDLTFGAAEFIYSPATPTKKGIVEIADESEVDAGTPNKAVDAYELKQLFTRLLTASLTDPNPSKIASAKAVYDLNTAIQNINSLLASDETTLDTLQEIVNFIELNRSDLDALTVASIAGLQSALNAKANLSHTHNSGDLPSATTSAKGIVEKATTSEMESGAVDKYPDASLIKSFVKGGSVAGYTSYTKHYHHENGGFGGYWTKSYFSNTSWPVVGGTGSGANLIISGMENIPSDAKTLKLRIGVDRDDKVSNSYLARNEISIRKRNGSGGLLLTSTLTATISSGGTSLDSLSNTYYAEVSVDGVSDNTFEVNARQNANGLGDLGVSIAIVGFTI
ncbi:MAG: hypothetical protein HWE39_12765 [Oceanospirillaceae bacterium]|nr:hypothetical protein [Oceanospirillaceae bacterium]